MTYQQHIPFIEEAIHLAEQAKAHGNHPFGALLVHDGQVILRAENTVVTHKDITGHAELNLVREGYRIFEPDVLQQCILYTSTEPCAMCAGAIFWAGIRTVAFGLPEGQLNTLAGSIDTLDLPCAEVFARGRSSDFTVIGPILEEEALQPHLGFWTQP